MFLAAEPERVIHAAAKRPIQLLATAAPTYLSESGITHRAERASEPAQELGEVGVDDGLVVLAEVERLDRRADAKAVSPVTEEAQASPAG